MRTFPRSLAAFRKIVNQRRERLRELSSEELQQLALHPIEPLTVEARPATIGIIVQSLPSGSIRVVIQGFMKAQFIPGKHVALDGFYKSPDQTFISDADQRVVPIRLNSAAVSKRGENSEA